MQEAGSSQPRQATKAAAFYRRKACVSLFLLGGDPSERLEGLLGVQGGPLRHGGP